MEKETVRERPGSKIPQPEYTSECFLGLLPTSYELIMGFEEDLHQQAAGMIGTFHVDHNA